MRYTARWPAHGALGIGAAIGWRGVVLVFGLFYIIAGLLNLAAIITYVVGQVFGCFAPPRKGARVLAIEASRTIVVDRSDVINLADRYGLTIVALPDQNA